MTVMVFGEGFDDWFYSSAAMFLEAASSRRIAEKIVR